MLFQTTEIRWFFRGPVPAPRDGFRYDEWSSPEARTDDYLVLAPSEAVGVKFRDGRFEIKARHGIGDETRLSAEASGMIESWQKWSLENSVAALRSAVGDTDEMLAVEKRRWMLVYDLDSDAPRIAEPGAREAGAMPVNRCHVEVTELTCAWQVWWSFGFEAAGTHGAELKNLLRGSQAFLQQHQVPVSLTPGLSFSYPAWLARVVDRPSPERLVSRAP